MEDINDILALDGRAIRVYADGQWEETQLYPPEQGSIGNVEDFVHYFSKPNDRDWVLVSGMSNQYGYDGPLMHPSEFLDESFWEYMREHPGCYATVSLLDEDEDSWAVMFHP